MTELASSVQDTVDEATGRRVRQASQAAASTIAKQAYWLQHNPYRMPTDKAGEENGMQEENGMHEENGEQPLEAGVCCSLGQLLGEIPPASAC
jgi:hypothetical protein